MQIVIVAPAEEGIYELQFDLIQEGFSAFAERGAQTFVVPVRGLTARPDGNNVSADREGMLLAEVQLQFKVATALIRSEFSGLTTAIREGQ